MAKKRPNVVDLRQVKRRRIEAVPATDGHAAYLREWYLPVAIIAAIPPGNVDAFLNELTDHLFTFNLETGKDIDRRDSLSAIDELAAAARTMIAAIENAEKKRHNRSGRINYLPKAY